MKSITLDHRDVFWENLHMGRIAGIDYGNKRIGVAVSDLGKMLASPKGIVEAGKDVAASVKNILAEFGGEEIEAYVVGLPLHLSGRDSTQTTIVRKFASLLEETSGKTVILWDERLTSAEVERVMKQGEMSRKKRTKHVDTLSATLILQNYLDSR